MSILNNLSNASILLVPSKFEGQPMVVLEALSLNTPVLISDKIHSLPEEIPRAKFEDLADWESQIETIFSSKSKQNEETLVKYSLSVLRPKWKVFYQSLLN